MRFTIEMPTIGSNMLNFKTTELMHVAFLQPWSMHANSVLLVLRKSCTNAKSKNWKSIVYDFEGSFSRLKPTVDQTQAIPMEKISLVNVTATNQWNSSFVCKCIITISTFDRHTEFGVTKKGWDSVWSHQCVANFESSLINCWFLSNKID